MTSRPKMSSMLPVVLAKSSIAVRPTDLEVFDGGTSMREGLLRIGSSAIHSAQEGKTTRVIVGITDKGRQNPINYLGGKETAGDTALTAYWDMLRLALALCRKRVEEEYQNAEDVRVYDVPMMRVSNRSDEGNIVFVVSGKNTDAVNKVSTEIRAEFDRNLDMLKDYLTGQSRPVLENGGRYPTLEEYLFSVPANLGGDLLNIPCTVHSNLKKFGDILKYAEMVVSLTYRLSSPIIVSGGEAPEFLLDEIGKLEEEDIEFRHALPDGIRIRQGRGSVDSPFARRLVDLDMGTQYIRDGFYFEVKLTTKPEDAQEVMKFTKDKWDGKIALGTRKGFSELLGFDIDEHVPEWGMRALNTFIGKAGANEILTAIAQAVDAIRSRMGAAVIPVDGHLRYQVRTNTEKESFVDAIKEEINRKMQGLGGSFRAVIRTIDSHNVEIAKVGKTFELLAMGRKESPEILEKTNFLVNFIETVKAHDRNIQLRVVTAIKFDSQRERLEVYDKLEKLREVFSAKRTIRDTSDLVAVLRNEKSLGISRETRIELEEWVFRFADRYYEQMRKNINAQLY